MFARTTSLLLAACAVLATSACDAELREQSENQRTAPAAPAMQPNAGTASLVQMMMDAPASTLLQGVRRFEAHWKVAGKPQDLVYREQLSCDGQGGFAVDPIETLVPSLGGGQQDLFFLLQKQREGFMFTHRDFMVRDLDLFYVNYQVVDLGVTTTVAGRECAQLDVQLQQAAESVYHIAVDLQTGMVLRVREESLVDGSLISLIEFETLDDTPDLSSTVFHMPLVQETKLKSMSQPLPFLARRPKLIPPSYELLTSTALENTPGGKTWVRYTYSDGVRELFFLYSGEPDLVAPGGIQPAAATTPNQDSVSVITVGPWNVVQGSVFGGDVIVMGMSPLTELLDMIESAFN